MNNFRVKCVLDENRPENVPSSKWIVKNQIYTVTNVGKMLVQGGIIGFELAEVSLEGCYPYQFYAASRFIPIVDSENTADKLHNELDRLLEEAREEFKEQEVHGLHNYK